MTAWGTSRRSLTTTARLPDYYCCCCCCCCYCCCSPARAACARAGSRGRPWFLGSAPRQAAASPPSEPRRQDLARLGKKRGRGVAAPPAVVCAIELEVEDPRRPHSQEQVICWLCTHANGMPMLYSVCATSKFTRRACTHAQTSTRSTNGRNLSGLPSKELKAHRAPTDDH